MGRYPTTNKMFKQMQLGASNSVGWISVTIKLTIKQDLLIMLYKQEDRYKMWQPAHPPLSFSKIWPEQVITVNVSLVEGYRCEISQFF